jgi:hypothetical protein
MLAWYWVLTVADIKYFLAFSNTMLTTELLQYISYFDQRIKGTEVGKIMQIYRYFLALPDVPKTTNINIKTKFSFLRMKKSNMINAIDD